MYVDMNALFLNWDYMGQIRLERTFSRQRTFSSKQAQPRGQTELLQVLSSLVLKTSQDGGRLFLCFTVLIVKKVFVLSSLNLSL